MLKPLIYGKFEGGFGSWAASSLVERFPDKKEVLGSIPRQPTQKMNPLQKVQLDYGKIKVPSFGLSI